MIEVQSDTSTGLALDNKGQAQSALSSSFGADSNRVRICSNGFIGFTGTSTSGTQVGIPNRTKLPSLASLASLGYFQSTVEVSPARASTQPAACAFQVLALVAPVANISTSDGAAIPFSWMTKPGATADQHVEASVVDGGQSLMDHCGVPALGRPFFLCPS